MLTGYTYIFFIFRANEYVRKVFSCAFMGRRSATELERQKFINQSKTNNLDFTSCEVQSMISLKYKFYCLKKTFFYLALKFQIVSFVVLIADLVANFYFKYVFTSLITL